MGIEARRVISNCGEPAGDDPGRKGTPPKQEKGTAFLLGLQ